LDLADNELIARLDSDDMVYENRLELQYNFLSASPEVLVVGSQVTYIAKENKILGNSSYPTGNINNDGRFHSSCLIAHPSVMYRKSSISKAGGYREIAKIGNTSLCEDFDLWKRIAKQGKLVNIKHELTFYRQHPGQLSNKFRYAQELATMFVKSEGFDKYNIQLEISDSGNINSKVQIYKSISTLSRIDIYKYLVYSKIIRKNISFKKLQSVIGLVIIRFLNLLIK